MKAREERGSEGKCENYMKLKLQGPHLKGFVCLPEMAAHDLAQVSFYLSLQTVWGKWNLTGLELITGRLRQEDH